MRSERALTIALIIAILVIMAGIAAMLIGPPAPLVVGAPVPGCAPSLTQPSAWEVPTPVARVAGCPGLVFVDGPAPGVRLLVERSRLAIDPAQIDALPEEGRR